VLNPEIGFRILTRTKEEKMKRILVAILAASLTVSFTGVIFAADPTQEVSPGQEMRKEINQDTQEIKDTPKKEMQEMNDVREQKEKEIKEMPEKKMDEMKEKGMNEMEMKEMK
jgi:hypothetical protein